MMKHYLLLATCFLCFSLGYHLNAQVVINEYCVTNVDQHADNYGEFPDWVELYNAGSTVVNLKDYGLSDNPDNPDKWIFPVNFNLPAHGYKIIWLSGRNESSLTGIHTNFKLTQTKIPAESLVLSDPTGAVLEEKVLEVTQLGHSRGRTTDGSSEWSVFTSPTFGSSNNSSTPYSRYAEKPVMSMDPGFYTNSFSLTISTNELNSVIRYTTNGSEPKPTSLTVTGPLTVSTTRVMKAKTFSSDPQVLPSLVEFRTYFFNVSHSLPVISVAADGLTDLLNGDASLVPYGSYEYFGTDDQLTTSSYGQINKHGQDSWSNPQRSIDVVSRDECGYNSALKNKFFKTSDRTEFQRLILRASGDDNYPAKDSAIQMRDDFIMTASDLMGQHLDWRRSHRCVLYANGQFWGVYAIRERDDDADYCEYYYGQDKYNLQFCMLWGGTWSEYGGQQAIDDYHDLYYYIMHNNMASPEKFDYVASQYDYTSLADYVIINSYVVCSDWINWNVGWWRGMDSTGTHKKWGYILWDEDATFNHYINYTGIPTQLPTATPCFQEDITQDPEGHIDILNRLRMNPTFNQYYVNRYVDLLNTGFKPSSMIPLLDSMAAMIEPEIPKHCSRWGGSLAEWQDNVQKVRDFINTRYNVVKDGLLDCYNLTGPYPVTLNVEPALKGKIQVNSITPETYPWEGFYYGGIDVLLKSIEIDPTYKFDHWELNNHIVQPSDTATLVRLQLLTNDVITAVFVPRTKNDTLVINEINYNSSPDFDPGDWVEIYNPQPYSVDVSGWVFKDEDDLHSYAIPQGTVMPAMGYLVLCTDITAFDALFPAVQNRVGPIGFGLSGNGELIRLYNPDVLQIDTVNYDDTAPWPVEPDGNGPTLELINPTLDNALASSWKASYTPHGTPGEPNFYVDMPEIPVANNRPVFKVYPNPMSGSATVSVQQDQLGRAKFLSIYDMMGKEVMKYPVTSETFIIQRGTLTNGVYALRLTDSEGSMMGTCRMVIQ
jgi:hypothetical protein